MNGDTYLQAMVTEAVAAIVSRNAMVYGDENARIAEEPLFDAMEHEVAVAAAAHPSDAFEAARDLLDRLATRGLVVRRAASAEGNGFSARLARLAVDLALSAGQQRLVGIIAERLEDLADEALQRDEVVIPPHLRLAPSGLPDGVVSLCGRRRA